MNTRNHYTRLLRVALIGSLAALAAACFPQNPPGTTTTASTTTSSSIPSGPCDTYTPTNVAVSDSTPTVGDTIDVDGNGVDGDEITITLEEVDGPGTYDPGVTATVAGGAWSASVSLTAGDVTPGEWDVVATSHGSCTATARIDVS